MGIFSGSSNHTCPTPDGFESYNIHGTRHNSLYYATAAFAALTFLSSVGLILMHLTRYRAPKEQRQIVRLCFTPFVFAIVSFGEVANYNIAQYIDPIGKVYESFGLCALFLLYIQFAAPAGTFGEEMFAAVSNAAEASGKDEARSNWPKTSWIAVFQYPITNLVSVIVLEATTATGDYCSTSLSPRFGHLWVQIISSLGLGVCVLAILRFYGRMKPLMKARRGLAKLVMFKIIVALGFIQTWIFSILLDRNVLKPSNSFSYGDLAYGIENTLLAAEMVVISLGFWYAYTPGEYSSNARPREEPLNFFVALFDALNPSDLLLGIVRGIGLLTRGSSSQAADLYGGFQASGPGNYGPVAGGPAPPRYGAREQMGYGAYDSDEYTKPLRR